MVGTLFESGHRGPDDVARRVQLPDRRECLRIHEPDEGLAFLDCPELAQYIERLCRGLARRLRLLFGEAHLRECRESMRSKSLHISRTIDRLQGLTLGVWGLASLPASLINRLIGALLLIIVVLEWRGRFPARLPGRWWGLGTGALAGVIGGAVGTPAPPVIVYATTQGWTPRTMKANLQAFFVVNQAVILAGYWWAGLLTPDVVRLAVSFAVPAAIGVLAGIALFGRIDAVRFRQIVFALLFLSGLVLLARG